MSRPVRLAPVLMVQGTASHVGKSTLVTALCRVFAQDGLRVAPFKAQNMALNSAVAVDGGEIGRAQAVQAEAAGLEPSTAMNPILLKPEGEARSQVVVNGRPTGSLSAAEYQRRKAALWPSVVAALDRLRREYDLVVAEGAGSPAEINLRHADIANMRVARHAEAAVLLVGDIDRGGVFASLLGTLELLPPDERALVFGLAINKFRGDPAILEPGLDALHRRTGVPIVGVIPHLFDLHLPEEDSLALDAPPPAEPGGALDVVVVRLPRISNFDEFDALAAEPAVRLRYVESPATCGEPDLVIIPGTKTTIADLAWLRASGLAARLVELRASGTPLLGICGGFQMLGRSIRDPLRVESSVAEAPGLGLLPITTTFSPAKRTARVQARLIADRGPMSEARDAEVSAYEIHMGEIVTEGGASPLLALPTGPECDAASVEGAVSEDGLVIGTSCHGLFDNDRLRHGALRWLARRRGRAVAGALATFERAAQYDRLAEVVRRSLDMDAIRRACGLG